MNEIEILWADDEILHLKPHILFLEEKGYKLTTVNNGLDAIEKFKTHFYDLVFLDENMPGIGGLDALKAIKEINGDVPVVMITKNEEEHIMEDAIGSKIADYLIKPVNPRQILLSIKKLTDQKRLVTASVTQRYQQDFGNIGTAIMDNLNWEQWTDLYRKITFWELEMDNSNHTGMEEVLKTQKDDGNRAFAKFITQNYEKFIPYDANPGFMVSHNVVKRGILPQKVENEPLVTLVLDNLRFDQWKTIQKDISEFYNTEKEDLYMSILPTTTQYARNAFFAGLMPSDIQKRFPDKWVSDEEEGGRNLHEEEFLIDQLQRLRKHQSVSYFKVTNLRNAKEMVEKLPNLIQSDLTFLVYNFIDTLSHARTDSKVMRELAEDEKAYRALTKNWFIHSPLFEAIKYLAHKKVKLIITTDHGSVRVNNAIVVKGEKELTTNLRYKTGRRLCYNAKEVFALQKMENLMLPLDHMTSSYIFSRNNDFFVYQNNLNHYARYYADTFQHGGISMEEMIVPLVTLLPK